MGLRSSFTLKWISFIWIKQYSKLTNPHIINMEKILRKLYHKIQFPKRPSWFKWHWLPDDRTPIQSVLEILLFIAIMLGACYLYVAFNRIPYHVISINADKLSQSRYISKGVNNDSSTYYLHYQRANVNLRMPRTTVEKPEALRKNTEKEDSNKSDTVFSCVVYHDSIPIGNLDSISENTLHNTGLTPYWRVIYDAVIKYCGDEKTFELKRNHNKYDNSYYRNADHSTSELEKSVERSIKESHELKTSYPFLQEIDSLNERSDGIYRFRLSCNVINVNQYQVDTTLYKSLKHATYHIFDYTTFPLDSVQIYKFESNRQGIVEENGYETFYLEHFAAEDIFRYDTSRHEMFHLLLNETGNLRKFLPIESPGMSDLYDMSQGWYEIHFNTATIDSVGLIIDFVGATQFFPMKIEPDETGSNYIKFSNTDKLLQIKKEGLTFYVQFKEMENTQMIRNFALTAIISGLFIVLLTFLIIGLYRAFLTIRRHHKYMSKKNR